ncbi:unnamed protein product [Caenorhabditis auriculariae]|uniref:Serine/threonine-protein phosphatase n=1 Tax=Caenorhabditis auriculariae TaxID=2777116 RepID=A0A8S1HTU1_9PELO|nr:unnamed protein product [Caenorhabditis auriculariae]
MGNFCHFIVFLSTDSRRFREKKTKMSKTESSKKKKKETFEKTDDKKKHGSGEKMKTEDENVAIADIDPNKFTKDIKKEKRESFKVTEFIAKHFRDGSKSQEYDVDEIHLLLDLVDQEMRAGPSLVEVRAPINVCGDVHGQYSDLMRIFKTCGKPMTQKYLFLGDYVDRGRHSLEVFLLRGNHEIVSINKSYGFEGELKMRYKSRAFELHEHFNNVFAYMPLAGLIHGRILCMHGGLSPQLNSFDDIRKIERPLKHVKRCPLAQDLLWADPEPGVQGYKRNAIRAVSHIFGEDAVHEMCKRLNIDLIIRAHQVVEYGYAFFAKKSLLTVFSASRYHEELHNYAAVVKVNADLELTFAQLKPLEFEWYRDEKKKNGETGDDEQVTSNEATTDRKEKEAK